MWLAWCRRPGFASTSSLPEACPELSNPLTQAPSLPLPCSTAEQRNHCHLPGLAAGPPLWPVHRACTGHRPGPGAIHCQGGARLVGRCWALPWLWSSVCLPVTLLFEFGCCSSNCSSETVARWLGHMGMRPPDQCCTMAVQGWRATGCMKGLDWSCLRCYRCVPCCGFPSCTFCLPCSHCPVPPPRQHSSALQVYDFQLFVARATLCVSALRCSHPLLCSCTGTRYLQLNACALYVACLHQCNMLNSLRSTPNPF